MQIKLFVKLLLKLISKNIETISAMFVSNFEIKIQNAF